MSVFLFPQFNCRKTGSLAASVTGCAGHPCRNAHAFAGSRVNDLFVKFRIDCESELRGLGDASHKNYPIGT